MYHEFLEISRLTERDVTAETYDKVIEPMYMNSDLSKSEFVSLLNLKAIKEKYPNLNKVSKEMVKLIAEMKKLLGYCVLHEEENKFEELAKEFCRLKGCEYCYLTGTIYEIPLYNRGCSMYTGFVAKWCNDYVTFSVDKKVEMVKIVH